MIHFLNSVIFTNASKGKLLLFGNCVIESLFDFSVNAKFVSKKAIELDTFKRISGHNIAGEG